MLQSIVEDKLNIAAALAETVAQGLAREDTDHATFRGCIDWHSAVHGTWALTAYGRMTGDRRHEELLGRVLDPAGIAAEHELIRARPEFEMPYGRAWFLRLASEHLHATGSEALQPMAADVLQSLLERYLGQDPNPWLGSYGSDCWALINMHDYVHNVGDSKALRVVGELVKSHFVECADTCDYACEAGHFMAVGTNWAWLVSRVLEQGDFDQWVQRFLARSAMPTPVTNPTNWHHHGLNFSRAWGLWGIAAATGSNPLRQACQDAYTAHFQETFSRPERWRGSYRGVAHWVPQFGMLALQPQFDSAATS
jgi:hypothetical protein